MSWPLGSYRCLVCTTLDLLEVSQLPLSLLKAADEFGAATCNKHALEPQFTPNFQAPLSIFSKGPRQWSDQTAI